MTEAEREFKEWQRQLALRCAAEDYKEDPRVFPSRPDKHWSFLEYE